MAWTKNTPIFDLFNDLVTLQARIHQLVLLRKVETLSLGTKLSTQLSSIKIQLSRRNTDDFYKLGTIKVNKKTLSHVYTRTKKGSKF
jgi:hypothetical protein